MRTRSVLLAVLVSFSSLETVVAALSLSATAGPAQSGPGSLLGPFFSYSPPLSVLGWVVSGLVYFQGRFSRGSRLRSVFARRGFGSEVYDLMVRMRGGGSRLALLRVMETPRHRLELARETGIDWKEVDREVGVMERFGLVKVCAESGTVKMYQTTEQGRLLLELFEEMGASPAEGR